MIWIKEMNVDICWKFGMKKLEKKCQERIFVWRNFRLFSWFRWFISKGFNTFLIVNSWLSTPFVDSNAAILRVCVNREFLCQLVNHWESIRNLENEWNTKSQQIHWDHAITTTSTADAKNNNQLDSVEWDRNHCHRHYYNYQFVIFINISKEWII